jgi:hypothetical protein
VSAMPSYVRGSSQSSSCMTASSNASDVSPAASASPAAAAFPAEAAAASPAAEGGGTAVTVASCMSSMDIHDASYGRFIATWWHTGSSALHAHHQLHDQVYHPWQPSARTHFCPRNLVYTVHRLHNAWHTCVVCTCALCTPAWCTPAWCTQRTRHLIVMKSCTPAHQTHQSRHNTLAPNRCEALRGGLLHDVGGVEWGRLVLHVAGGCT